MLDAYRAAGQGREKVNLGMVEEIIILALESLVRLLLDLEHHVAGEDAGKLVTLATELDLVAVLHAAVNVDVQDLALHSRFLAIASLAAILVPDHLSLALAVRADGLETLNHGTHLAHHRLHTGTAAAGALAHCTLLSTTTVTSRADDRLLQSQLGNLASVDVLQADLVHMVDCPGLLGALVPHATEHAAEGTAAAAEELREQVLCAHSSGRGTTTFQTLLTILVVNLSLLGIGQNLIGTGELLEFLGSVRVILVLVFNGIVSSCDARPGRGEG